MAMSDERRDYFVQDGDEGVVFDAGKVGDKVEDKKGNEKMEKPKKTSGKLKDHLKGDHR
jgi:hypothetical protein